MPTIDDIGRDITQLSDQQLEERIRAIRAGRRAPLVRKTRKSPKGESFEEMIGKMTPEQAAKLLEALGQEGRE